MPLRTGLVSFISPYLATDSTIAVAGESAASLAEDLVRNGSAPLSVEADQFALLSDALDPPTAGRIRDLPDESVDLVILRRAWRARADVAEALSTAVRAVRPGGEVIATDIDVNQLLAGPSPRYPVRLLYLAEPMAAAGLRSSTVAPGVLGIKAVRAGLEGVESLTFDDDRGTYETIADFWSAVQKRGWRGAAWVSQDRSRSLFEDVARSMAGAHPAGWAVDREPWYAVIGRRR